MPTVGRYTISYVRKDLFPMLEERLTSPPYNYSPHEAKEKVRDITTFLMAFAVDSSENEDLIRAMWMSGRVLRESLTGVAGTAGVLQAFLEDDQTDDRPYRAR